MKPTTRDNLENGVNSQIELEQMENDSIDHLLQLYGNLRIIERHAFDSDCSDIAYRVQTIMGRVEKRIKNKIK
jgi:hypothetical protein